MKRGTVFILLTVIFTGSLFCQAKQEDYLYPVRLELQKQWPGNRTVNLVFHGHSVPAGYFATPDVNTTAAYPNLVLEAVKKQYSYAAVNCIVTAIGGENSEQGAARFDSEVLNHRPDVLFIDYALNDRSIGLQRARPALEAMIEKALAGNIKVILLTPSPDLSVDILDDTSALALHAAQIRDIAAVCEVGIADSYGAFRDIVAEGGKLDDYMSWPNHPNEKGHAVIAEQIMQWFTTTGSDDQPETTVRQ
jgi:lysophospholipase L1-like esterase